MNPLPRVVRLLDHAPDQAPDRADDQPPDRADDRVVLDYDARLIRRKRLETAGGASFLVDLPAVTNLDDHWGFELDDGRIIEVVAADEDVLVVTGDLPRLAWHVGNRHTPCQFAPDRLVIRADHVLEAMLRQLGATVTAARTPFRPEGGAYGTGRTMGHAHGHGHDDRHEHGHHHHHHHHVADG